MCKKYQLVIKYAKQRIYPSQMLMLKTFNIKLQHYLPQHALSSFAGKLADVRTSWIKNLLIQNFIRTFHVNMSEAEIEDPTQFTTFNDFFTRKLKPSLRPVAGDPYVASPADGTISQLGKINQAEILQAKNHNYTLNALLANDQKWVDAFSDGSFATIYLAPHNYHRVHMPLTGKLVTSIYVPGKLFSVNNTSAEMVPSLFSNNERLINIFETAVGPMAVILVGAIIVGSIKMVWQNNAYRSNVIQPMNFSNSQIQYKKGDEIGLFKLGSTVILLFEKNVIEWQNNLQAGSEVTFGSPIASLKTS